MTTPSQNELLSVSDKINQPQYLSEYAARAAATELARHWESHLSEECALEQLLEQDLNETIRLLTEFGEKLRVRFGNINGS